MDGICATAPREFVLGSRRQSRLSLREFVAAFMPGLSSDTSLAALPIDGLTVGGRSDTMAVKCGSLVTPLFKDPTMARTQIKTVKIAHGRNKYPLSKAQKTFNARIKQIEKLRALRAAWDGAIPPFQQKYASDLHPLIEASTDLQVKLVHRLDGAHGLTGLTQTERRILRSLIIELTAELLSDRDDAALKAVYNKHTQSDFDGEQAAELEEAKSMFEDMLGIELGDDVDMRSPDELLRRAQAQMEADVRARELRQAARKKSPKQLAREASQQAEEAQVNQSIREIYRKLASALHPDREPDPQARDRKTELMQRVNQAYDKRNLLQLLELQLELEHISPTAINELSEDRLIRYNQILKDQVRELEHELRSVEGHFRMQFGVAPFEAVSPGGLMRLLAFDLARVRQGMREMERDMNACDDVQALKVWIKTLRH